MKPHFSDDPFSRKSETPPRQICDNTATSNRFQTTHAPQRPPRPFCPYRTPRRVRRCFVKPRLSGVFAELKKGSRMPNPLYRQHVISISDLTTEQLELLLQTALKLKADPRDDLLEGKLIGSCFFEPSTRTRLSFETAVQRLGGKVIGFSDGANTSAKKGETLADTARIISSYTDAIIQRHPKDGAARVSAEFSKVPVINAGDGTNQHPSQTLLDLVTIYETQGRLNKLKIAMAGDLKYGRTVHSLCQALKRWDCEFAFVSPPSLAMPEYITEELKAAGCRYQILPDLETAVEWADILYMTRVQRERFDEQEFAKIQGKFNLNAAMLANARPKLRVLHPLPRVDEIHPDVDATPHAYYFEQATNGVYARMAILSLVLNEEV